MILPSLTTSAFLAASLHMLTTSSHAEQFKKLTYIDKGTSITITGNTFDATSIAPVTIPATIHGKSVTAIGPWALWGLKTSGVTIPSSVTSIGDYAFHQCHGLVSVTFPPSITYIGKAAFGGSENYERGLSSVVFTGKAPTVNGNPFRDSVHDFKIFVEKGATGFTLPRWNGSKVSKPAPEIEVFSPEVPAFSYYKSAYFKSGESILNFKNVLVGGKSTSKTLLIRNVGSRDLLNLKVALVGSASSDFKLLGSPKTKIKPGDMATLKLRFKPLSRGPRKAELRITSNDSDENPFVVLLKGRGLKLME